MPISENVAYQVLQLSLTYTNQYLGELMVGYVLDKDDRVIEIQAFVHDSFFDPAKQTLQKKWYPRVTIWDPSMKPILEE